MKVERCRRETLEDWVKLRCALWPEAYEDQLRREAAAYLDQPQRAIAFLARDDDRTVIGFAEATLRHDNVNGCETSPVVFLEGIYVVRAWRHRGVARLLCGAIEDWARQLGCAELASDTGLRNRASQKMHVALGFEETERVVYYRKPLRS